MNDKVNQNAHADALVSPESSATEKQKKEYQKPALIYQAPLEAMAAVCTGQFGKTSGHCAVANS